MLQGVQGSGGERELKRQRDCGSREGVGGGLGIVQGRGAGCPEKRDCEGLSRGAEGESRGGAGSGPASGRLPLGIHPHQERRILETNPRTPSETTKIQV